MAFILIGQTFLRGEDMKTQKYVEYVREISEEFVNEIQTLYKNVYCIGSGGSMPKAINEIDIRFVSRKALSLDEARKMEVDAAERLIKKINSHNKIRPYLAEYPFGINRINVSFSFQDDHDMWPLDGNIALVFLARGRIIYRKAQLEKEIRHESTEYVGGETIYFPPKEITREVLIPLYEEPYEEALKIVKGSK